MEISFAGLFLPLLLKGDVALATGGIPQDIGIMHINEGAF